MIKVLDTRKVFASATASQGEYEASDKFGIGLQSWQAALAQIGALGVKHGGI